MVYLTQVTTVLITLIQDALKKEEILVVQHSSNLLLIGLETKQDRGRVSI
jgi:hypothetical protein